jgi:hypothetical protein
VYVVVWEPRGRRGGGHQLVMDRAKADRISMIMARAMPDAQIRIEPAERYAAAAVVERQQQRRNLHR